MDLEVLKHKEKYKQYVNLERFHLSMQNHLGNASENAS